VGVQPGDRGRPIESIQDDLSPDGKASFRRPRLPATPSIGAFGRDLVDSEAFSSGKRAGIEVDWALAVLHLCLNPSMAKGGGPSVIRMA